MDHFNMVEGIPNMNKNYPCTIRHEFLDLRWDCICFFFLVMQKRIFKSYYFLHIVNDTKAETILGHRGAIIIEEKNKKRKAALDAQTAILKEKINKKVERNRNKHSQRLGSYIQRRKRNHKAVLRTGDYYLWEDIATDVDLVPPKLSEIEEDATNYDKTDPHSFTEYIMTATKKGAAVVMQERSFRRRQKKALMLGKKVEDVKITEPTPSSEKSCLKKLQEALIFLLGIVESLIVSITRILNSFSMDFRIILTQIAKERKFLKENAPYTQGKRIGANKIWHSTQSFSNIISNAKEREQPTITHSFYAKFLVALWNFILSKSEFLCYFFIILNQLIRANFISLPLPVMVFCWASLTVPYPTKTFWVTTTGYILIVLMIKNFFAMEVATWNEYLFLDNPFYPPTVIGIVRGIPNVFLTLSLLGSLCFHRTILELLGLWKHHISRHSSLMEEGEYYFKNGQFTKISKGVSSRGSPVFLVTNAPVPIEEYFPRSLLHGARKYAEGFKIFIQELIMPRSTLCPVDVYTPMFWCDLINLLIVFFFFNYFVGISEELGFIGFIMNNRVPMAFIMVALCLLFLIVIDRWIYMKRNRFAKLVFHFFQVMFYHIWFFILYPNVTKRKFTSTPAVQAFYAFKCFYFLLSSYQIRHGYPLLISCHYLWHEYSLMNRSFFLLYTLTPYIFELRTILDWTVCDTSLGISDWLKLEAISIKMYELKCAIAADPRVSHPPGQPQKRISKLIMGGLLFSVLVFTLILPFLVFSLGSSVGGITTHPAYMNLNIYLGSTEAIFNSQAIGDEFKTLSTSDYAKFSRLFNNIKEAGYIFGSFEAKDVQVVKWSQNSDHTWIISPASYDGLIEEITSDQPLTIRLEVQYLHVGSGGQREEKKFGQSTVIPPLPNEERQNLLDMLQGHGTKPIRLILVFPKFFLITKEGDPKVLPLMEDDPGIHTGDPGQFSNDSTRLDMEDDDIDIPQDASRLRNLLLSLEKRDGEMWWKLQEECLNTDDNYEYYLKHLIHNGCDDIVLYNINEKVFSTVLSVVGNRGILGMYLIYFMVIASLLKEVVTDVEKIWIEDVPNADRFFKKCLSVYIARDMKNFELEEEFLAELIFAMRSHEITIKMGREEDNPYKPPSFVEKKG